MNIEYDTRLSASVYRVALEAASRTVVQLHMQHSYALPAISNIRKNYMRTRSVLTDPNLSLTKYLQPKGKIVSSVMRKLSAWTLIPP